jgi:hypothetical protein
MQLHILKIAVDLAQVNEIGGKFDFNIPEPESPLSCYGMRAYISEKLRRN